MAVHGHSNGYFMSNLPTDTKAVLFCTRLLAVALVHPGVYGGRIPPAAVRIVYPECFSSLALVQRRGISPKALIYLISLNSVTLKVQSLSSFKASERVQTDFPCGTGHCPPSPVQTGISITVQHLMEHRGNISSPPG